MKEAAKARGGGTVLWESNDGSKLVLRLGSLDTSKQPTGYVILNAKTGDSLGGVKTWEEAGSSVDG